MKVVGLMSGTSLDGIDAALLEVRGHDASGARCQLLSFVSRPYGDAERERLRAATENRSTTSDLCRLHVEMGEWLAGAVQEACRAVEMDLGAVDAVGSHGQTVWHDPPAGERAGASLQIGSPAVVAERTGIAVVADFRARDLAAGGHGAPLVPFADRILFAAPGRRRALQNLGGMGNVTLLPPRESDDPPLGFDTGPGVALLDAAAEMATGGRLRCDRDGRMAAAGTLDPELLGRLVEIPFLDQEPPRSTGRELFGAPMVRELARERGLEPGVPEEGWPDLLATLTAFTARTVGDAYRRWIVPRGVDEVHLTGGGARNPVLVEAVREELEPVLVRPPGELDVDPDAREAAAFAVLAWAHLRGIPGSVPGVTGARGRRVLGSLTPGRGAAGEAADPPGGETAT